MSKITIIPGIIQEIEIGDTIVTKYPGFVQEIELPRAVGVWIPVRTNNVDGTAAITRFVNQDYPGWFFDIEVRFGVIYAWNAAKEDENGSAVADTASSGNQFSYDGARNAAIDYIKSKQ